ncbi:serine hydrolase domain-containing protein [Pseudonocardia pini]|uniref:serine hydrolase domain-containing protein n=1 Tax=Pseudonocardia pini TaxID=2758030 RepID=UPI0015EFF062|nr:serine hydrolase domain-containing protein [Pseudonocardia pini]
MALPRLVTALAGAVLALAACSTAPAPAAAPPAPDYAAALEPQITALMAQLQIPGASLYVDVPGRGTWQTALGSTTDQGGRPMSVEDHFKIGSVTKTLTAEVVLQLVDAKKVGLEDPVTKYWPGVPNGDAITVRQLLDMTAGLFNYTEDGYFNLTLDKDPTRPWTTGEVLGIALAHPPYFPPGQGYHYSNTNYELLGAIAEKASGTPLPTLVRETVFDKLGMTQSSLPAWSDGTLPEPHPQGYMFGTNEEGNAAYNAALAGDKANAQITVAPGTRPNDVTDLPTNGQASGGAVSTAKDMAIWAKALATGSLLSPEVQAERVRYGADSGYGLGVMRTAAGLVGHDGAVPGFQSSVYFHPPTGTTIVVLTNLLLAPNTYFAEALPAERIVGLVREAVIPA